MYCWCLGEWQMKQVIVSSVGISILSIINKDKWFPIVGVPIDRETEYIQLMDELLIESMEKSNGLPLEDLGAEISSLDKMGVQSGDKLYFLTSNTLDGKLVGQILKQIVEDIWQVEANYITVEGLQVYDANEFCLTGIPNLVDKVTEVFDKYPSPKYKHVLNTTGGYKATGLYLTILGMIEGVVVKYVFERAKEIIEMPATPVYFDIESLYRLGINNVSKMVRHKIKEEELKKITGRNIKMLREEFKDVLVFEPDGMVTLSPLARIVYLKLVRENSGGFYIYNFPK
jgi:putative CRISPR-associated protein (TIGR02619 family)